MGFRSESWRDSVELECPWLWRGLERPYAMLMGFNAISCMMVSQRGLVGVSRAAERDE